MSIAIDRLALAAARDLQAAQPQANIGNILKAAAPIAASFIPGVGPIVAPLVGAALSGGGGGGGGGGGPSGAIGSAIQQGLTAAQAEQLQQQNMKTAQQIMQSAMSGVQGATGSTIDDFFKRLGGISDPATAQHSAYTVNPTAFSGVTPPQVGSVFGAGGPGSIPGLSSGPSDYYATALALAQGLPQGGAGGSFGVPPSSVKTTQPTMRAQPPTPGPYPNPSPPPQQPPMIPLPHQLARMDGGGTAFAGNRVLY
jgi:hypothetical protein